MDPLEIKIPLKIRSDNTIKTEVDESIKTKLKIEDENLITLKVDDRLPIKVKIQNEDVIKLKVSDGCGGGGGDYPVYDGPTYIIPKPYDEITIRTNQKTVLSNIVVAEIPHYETGNIKGTTFIIGG